MAGVSEVTDNNFEAEVLESDAGSDAEHEG